MYNSHILTFSHQNSTRNALNILWQIMVREYKSRCNWRVRVLRSGAKNTIKLTPHVHTDERDSKINSHNRE